MRYDKLKQVNKRLETPKDVHITLDIIGDYRVITGKKGARLDNIAFDVYQDPSLWWVLARVNSLSFPILAEQINLIIPLNPNMVAENLT